MNIQLGRFPSQRQLFKPKLFPPSYTGPWGSLVSFVLGVHVTPVQIWAGPLSASLITTFAQSSQHSLMHRGHSASLNATQMHLNQAVGYYNRSRGRSRPSRFPPSQTAISRRGEGPAECPGRLRLCRGAGSLPSGQVRLRPDRHVANEVVVIHAVVHVVQAGWPEEIRLLRVDVES